MTAAELHELFRDDENLRVAAEIVDGDSGSRYPGAVAAMNAARFGLQEPDVRPFENSYYWAPFVFVGSSRMLDAHSGVERIVAVVADDWDELPAHFGSAWVEVFPRIAELTWALDAASDPDRNAVLCG